MGKENYFKEKKDWSRIKDDLLESYLTLYFQKILTTGRPVVYIDAFAGKGLFDDGEKGSPLIALEISDLAIQRSKQKYNHIEHYFIEHNYADELANNIKERKAHVIKGTYEDNIGDILKVNTGKNIFLYVDPFGIKSLHFDKFNLLDRRKFYSVELLLNLNSFGFLREGCRLFGVEGFKYEGLEEREYFEGSIIKNDIRNMDKVANGTYWQSIIADYKNGLIDGFEAEERFVKEYCQQLEQIFDYVINIPIKAKKLKNMPKYRMVFGSNKKDGVIKMADNMYKRWKTMQENEQNGQLALFEMDRNFRGDYIELNYEKIIFDTLGPKYIRYDDFLCNIIKNYGVLYDISKINQTIKKLEENKRIDVYRIPEFTPKTGKKATWVDWKFNKKDKIDLKVKLKDDMC